MTETAKPTNKARNKQPTYKPQYDLSEFIKFRGNQKSFDAFVKYFLIKAYSREWQNATVDSSTRLSTVMTVSDEAFVCLVLENNWERWLNINDKSKNRYAPSRRGSSDRITTNILPKYTNINGHPSNEGESIIRGWSDAGIARFNELCKIVKKDRKQNATVENVVFETIRSEMMETKRLKKRRRPNRPHLKAYVDNDDSESSDDDSENSDE